MTPKSSAKKRETEPHTTTPRPAEPGTKGPSGAKKGVLRFIAFGGGNDIGKNCMAYEYEDDIVVIDMGLTFPDETTPGIDYIVPDVSYLEQNKEKIRAIIITHAHEDHIGGTPYIWPKLKAPVYATSLTIGLLERKMEEFPSIPKIPTVVIDPAIDKVLEFGKIRIEPFRLAHSIPGNIGVSVLVPGIGRVVHSMEFRFDFNPIDKWSTDVQTLARWGDEGVLALLSDSVNALEAGFTAGEQFLSKVFDQVFRDSPGRVVVASFSSQINRLQQIVNAIHASGRKVAIAGRSMLKYMEVAVNLGYLKLPPGLLVKLNDIKNLPDNKIVIISTGSQGETNSALMRMAFDQHKQVKIKKGDTVLISASPIPGNERQVARTIDGLYKLGANIVVDEADSRTHVSGHPVQGELQLMLNLVRPQYFLPINGEFRMQKKHGEIAEDLGVLSRNIFLVENGDIVEFHPDGTAKLSTEKVPAGDVYVDGSRMGDVQNVVLRDRQIMASEGIFVVIAAVSKQTGKVITSPDIISRGFIYMKEAEELMGQVRKLTRQIIERQKRQAPVNWSPVRGTVRDDVSQFLYEKTGRRPIVIPVIIEV